VANEVRSCHRFFSFLLALALATLGTVGYADSHDTIRWVCPFIPLGTPPDPKTFPTSGKSIFGFMNKFAPGWARSREESSSRNGGRIISEVYYSKAPVEHFVMEGTRRVRFERHGTAGNFPVPRHSEMHAHFEIYQHGTWKSVPNPSGVEARGGRGSGWLPTEGIPPGFFHP
jgi:hypothetical protein